jgi:hypothetical protein
MKYRSLLIGILLFVTIFWIVGYYTGFNQSKIRGVTIVELNNSNKHMVFYGSRHCNDKNDPIFKDIEKWFYKLNPQIVLVEGYYDTKNYIDADNAIQKGEMAYVSYLAQKNNVKLGSVEPSMEEQYEYLLGKYDSEKVLAMYVLRQLNQYQKQQGNRPMSFPEVLEEYIVGLSKSGFPVEEEECNIAFIQKLLNPYLKEELNENNWTQVDAYSIVYNKGTDINEIYQEIYVLRNENLKAVIRENLKQYDRVFIMMGSQHVLDEKEHVKEVFENITAKK